MKLLPLLFFAVALFSYSCFPTQLTIEDESPKLALVGPNGFCIAKDEKHLIEIIRDGKDRPNADIEVNSIQYRKEKGKTIAVVSFTILPDHEDNAIFYEDAD